VIIRLLYSTAFAAFISAHDFGIKLSDIDIIYVGIFSLSVFLLPIITESIRGALLSIPRNQYEAAYSIGLTGRQTFHRVILPQMLPTAMPVLVNNFIILLKSSSLLFLIGVMDIYNGSLRPANLTYGFFEGYVAAGVIYFVIFFIVERLGAFMEKKFAVGKHRAVKGAGV
jgi:L-cystine transport system permease protein